MDFQSMRNWQLAQKRLSEGETHCGQCLKKIGIVLAFIVVYAIVYAMIG